MQLVTTMKKLYSWLFSVKIAEDPTSKCEA